MWTPAEVLTMVRLSPGPLVSSFEDVFVLIWTEDSRNERDHIGSALQLI